MHSSYVNSVHHDQKPCFVASDLGLQCLPMWGARQLFVLWPIMSPAHLNSFKYSAFVY